VNKRWCGLYFFWVELRACWNIIFKRPTDCVSVSSGYCQQVIHRSKLFWQTCLLEYSVRCMSGFDGLVYDESDFGDGAVPDFVITPSLPLKKATILAQIFFQVF